MNHEGLESSEGERGRRLSPEEEKRFREDFGAAVELLREQEQGKKKPLDEKQKQMFARLADVMPPELGTPPPIQDGVRHVGITVGGIQLTDKMAWEIRKRAYEAVAGKGGGRRPKGGGRSPTIEKTKKKKRGKEEKGRSEDDTKQPTGRERRMERGKRTIRNMAHDDSDSAGGDAPGGGDDGPKKKPESPTLIAAQERRERRLHRGAFNRARRHLIEKGVLEREDFPVEAIADLPIKNQQEILDRFTHLTGDFVSRSEGVTDKKKYARILDKFRQKIAALKPDTEQTPKETAARKSHSREVKQKKEAQTDTVGSPRRRLQELLDVGTLTEEGLRREGLRVTKNGGLSMRTDSGGWKFVNSKTLSRILDRLDEELSSSEGISPVETRDDSARDVSESGTSTSEVGDKSSTRSEAAPKTLDSDTLEREGGGEGDRETTAPDEDEDREKGKEPPARKRFSRKIVFVEAEKAIDRAARDAADRRLTASKEELKGVRGFLTKIWKHNLFHEYYRQKEIAKARHEVSESKNLYGAEELGNDRLAHDEAMKALVTRFASEYEEAVHTQAGESRAVLGDSSEENQVRAEIQTLIQQYAHGGLTDEDFAGERDRLLMAVSNVRGEVVDKGSAYADNLLEIAREVRQAVEHGARLEDIDLQFDVIVGKAKAGVRTEAQFNAVDRVIDKIQKSKVGRFFNETTAASAVAITHALSVGVSQRLAQSRLFAWGSFGATAVLGAGIAGTRESRRLEEERRQHARESAEGRFFDKEKSPRRNEMEKYLYEMRSAADLADALEQSLYKITPEGERTVRDLNAEELQSALAKLANIESRIQLSDRDQVDLIRYSDVRNVEDERLRLDILRAQAKVDLRKIEDVHGLFGGRSVDEYLTTLVDVQSDYITHGDEGIEVRNRLFKKMKRKGIAKAAMKGLLTGLVIGGAAQEVGAFFRDEQVGALEQLARGKNASGNQLTSLEYMRSWITDQLPPAAFAMHEITVGGGTVKLPEGFTILENTDGTFRMEANGKVFAENLAFDPDGSLNSASEQLLAEKDFHISSEVENIATTTTATLSAQEYVTAHPEGLTEVDRVLWYDNDTPAPVFDRNELRLWWGGENNSGLTASGEYGFSVAQMMEDGSFHKNLSADAQELMKQGKLTLILSLSQDTPGQVFEIPISPTGEAMIDPNSEAGRLLFREVNGKAEFLGKYAEVAEMVGQKDGVGQVRVLATHVGEGLDDIETVVPGTEQVVHTILDREVDYVVDPPLVIPLMGRRPLEPSELKAMSDVLPSYYYGYGGEGYGLIPREQYRERISPKIVENSELDVVRDDSEIIDEYLNRQRPEYRAELEQMVTRLSPMSSDTKVVIAIPAYREGKNLEKTIRNYAKLNGRERFELVIFENNSASVERDNSADVISRMKDEYPDMRIVHLYKQFDDKPTIGNVRKYLNDAILLRKQQAGLRQSVVMVSHDADLEDIHEKYVDILVRTFESNLSLDAIAGRWDYPREAYKQFPLLHGAQRLWHYLDIALRYNYLKSPELIGRNSAFRSGIYAAIGGYGETSQLAEDLEIGWLIKEARRYDNRRIKNLNAAWLVSNPRRAIMSHLSGRPIVQQYGDFHVNEEVREASLDDLLRDREDFGEERFQQEVQAIYDHYAQFKESRGGWIEDVYLDRSFDRAMRFLKVGYTIDNGRVQITNTDRLREDLEQYTTSRE